MVAHNRTHKPHEPHAVGDNSEVFMSPLYKDGSLLPRTSLRPHRPDVRRSRQTQSPQILALLHGLAALAHHHHGQHHSRCSARNGQPNGNRAPQGSLPGNNQGYNNFQQNNGNRQPQQQMQNNGYQMQQNNFQQQNGFNNNGYGNQFDSINQMQNNG